MGGGGRMETYDGPAFTRLSLCRSSLGVVLGDLVDVATWGIVPCVSKIDTLGLFHSLLKDKLNCPLWCVIGSMTPVPE